MKTKWFGDNRDIVKWSALLHIAKRHESSVIVQVCFLNRYKFPSITVGGTAVPVPSEVTQHFRLLRSVETLSSEVSIKVFDRQFSHRCTYLKSALEFVGQFSGQSRVVFLDPDTGLAPRKADLTHVTESEAQAFWAALASGDVLALYQHQTNRKGMPWIQEKRKQFASAIGIPLSQVRLAKGPLIARDVVFYYASKV